MSPDPDGTDAAGPDTARPSAADNPASEAEAPPPEPSAQALPALIEALLFVADGPVEASALTRALNISGPRLQGALEPLAKSLANRGMRLQTGPEGLQLVTAPETAPYVEYFLGLEARRRLSNAALETLAVVTYRQPVTRATVESIRGVNSDAPIATLRTRGLIAEGGRAPGPGRPLLFVTTQRFLEHFGLEHPEDLPKLPPLEESEAPEEPDEPETADQPEESGEPGTPQPTPSTEPTAGQRPATDSVPPESRSPKSSG